MPRTEKLAYIWLSFPLSPLTPVPPGIPRPELVSLYSVGENGSNVHVLKVSNHSGTHVDAPRHVFDHGAGISDWGPEELVFTRPVVCDLALEDAQIVGLEHLEPHADKLGKADIAMFRFGRGSIRRLDPVRYAERSPGFSPSAAAKLRQDFPGLKAVGIDLPSIICIPRAEETRTAHHELLKDRFLIVEDMDLEQDLDGLREVRLCPWRVYGIDSAPCSVIGVIQGGKRDV